jgi:hypothetical protein
LVVLQAGRGAKQRRGSLMMLLVQGAEGDGSKSAMVRGGARDCELEDWKIEAMVLFMGLKLLKRADFDLILRSKFS